MFHIDANLDQEATWLGAPIKREVRRYVTAMSALCAVFAPADTRADDITVWGLEPVEVPFFRGTESWPLPHFAYGTPPRVDLAWADRDARTVNDRRFALAVAHELECAQPGTIVVQSIAEVEAHLAAGGAGPRAQWVCKAPWASAGRNRLLGRTTELRGDVRIGLGRLLDRAGALVFERWLDRICDVAVCGRVGAPAGGTTTIEIEGPHGLLVEANGAFHGIDLASTGLEVAEHDQLVMVAERVGLALQRAGYRGPFGIDAFVYRDAVTQARRLHPLCEINARHTFGHVARALGRRLGITRLGFTPGSPRGASMPGGARPLLVRGDLPLAWVE
jgi:hypothetical protein